MDTYVLISWLNDFIFCPRSIYFHQLYGKVSNRLYHRSFQIRGTNAHKSIDQKKYTPSKNILQGIDVYSEKYQLCGKIDLYDKKNKLLVERKKKIKTIYDGYMFQLYAQYFCLTEMGYPVEKLKLYSMDDNKNYYVELPENDVKNFKKFEVLLEKIKSFNLLLSFVPNANKCRNCIYSPFCDYSLHEVEDA